MENKEIIQFAINYVKDKLASSGVMFLERRGNVVIFDIIPAGFLILRESTDGYRIIGYSDRGKFASNPIVDSIISDSDIIASKKQKAPDVKNKFEPITPLIKTEWNQYGHSLPKAGMVAGCVPTGLAQLVYYHKHPMGGRKSTQKYTYRSSRDEEITIPSIDLPNVYYEWDKMPEIIDENTTVESIASVADLMYHIGASMKTKFDYFETGVSVAAIKGTLHDYFGYDIEDLLFTNSNTASEVLTKTKLTTLIYDSLRKKRPVFVGGGKPSSTSGGHLFLGSGIDRDGLIYFNFGWGGSGDGYYDIFDTGYASQMIIGFNYKPAEPDYLSLVEYTPLPLEVQHGENINVNTIFKNENAQNFSGNIGLGININMYDSMVSYSPAVFDVISPEYIEKLPTASEAKLSLNGIIPDGYSFGDIYFFFMARNSCDNTEWRYVDRTPLKIIYRRRRTPAGFFLSSKMHVEELVYPGWQGKVIFEVSNHSDDTISGHLILCFVDDCDNITHKVSAPCLISIDRNTSEVIPIEMFIQKEINIDKYQLRILFINHEASSETTWQILSSDKENNENRKTIGVCNIVYESTTAKIMQSLDIPDSGVRGETQFISTVALKNTGDVPLMNPNGLISLILMDDINKVHTFIDNNDRIGLPPHTESAMEIQFKVPENIEIGDYTLALRVDDIFLESERHEVYLFSPGAEGVISKKLFSVLPDTVARFVKLTQNLVTPNEIGLGMCFDLSVACTLTKSKYFFGFLEVTIANHSGDVFELGVTEMILINKDNDASFTITCMAKENVIPGDYYLYVVGYDFDDDKNLAILSGANETIIDRTVISIKA